MFVIIIATYKLIKLYYMVADAQRGAWSPAGLWEGSEWITSALSAIFFSVNSVMGDKDLVHF